MLNSTELKELSSMGGADKYFISLYLNVDPLFNSKGDYMVHFKNMIKDTIEAMDKAVYKRLKADIERIEHYVVMNKRIFKKGLALISSSENNVWKEYHLNVPVKNEIIVNSSPYIKPLLHVLDNYQRYALLLVDKESARIFVIHLGEIVEYGEVHTADIPGKHKKGGWFALSQNHYERHIDYHIGMHLKDVVNKFDAFLSGEYIGRIIIGGSDEAVSMVKGMLNKSILDKLIGTAKIEMFAKPDEVLKRVETIVSAYEKKKEQEEVEDLIAKALKNENAVLGLDNVLSALQEKRVMKLFVIRDYKAYGYRCVSCGYLNAQRFDSCPYCNGNSEDVDYIANLAGEMAIQQGALIEVVDESKSLMESGGIGALLRF